MKETNPRKTIMKQSEYYLERSPVGDRAQQQFPVLNPRRLCCCALNFLLLYYSKDLRQPPLNGLKSAMTASRKPVTKEVFVPRALSHRYTELPSLRYGATPSQTAFHLRESGPLRVSSESSACKKKTVCCGKPSPGCPTSLGCRGNCTGNSLGSCNGDAPPVRRVHFAELPPKSNSFAEFREVREEMGGGGGGGGKGGEIEEKERKENCLRSKVGIPCTDGSSVSSSSRFARHGLPSHPSFPSAVKIAGIRLGNSGDIQGSTVFANPGTLRGAARGHDTARYRHGTLIQASGIQASAVLKAAKNGGDEELAEVLRKASLFGISPEELNAPDASGRTALSYIASNGTLPNLKAILQLPKIDVNKQDNEGNTPLHFAAQAGQVELINYMLSVSTDLEVDARNALGFTPLMKAALQGRTKCAKLLLFAGASPTLRDSGRGLRAEQWARFCGRYVCADVIEKFTRHKLLDRNTSYGRWGSEPELAARVTSVKPSPSINIQNSTSIKTKLRKAFRTMSHPGSEAYNKPFSVVSQLTSAALCASSPVLQSSVSPSVKSLMRPLSVPKVQVTLASNCTYGDDFEPSLQHSSSDASIKEKGIRLASRSKKKK